MEVAVLDPPEARPDESMTDTVVMDAFPSTNTEDITDAFEREIRSAVDEILLRLPSGYAESEFRVKELLYKHSKAFKLAVYEDLLKHKHRCPPFALMMAQQIAAG